MLTTQFRAFITATLFTLIAASCTYRASNLRDVTLAKVPTQSTYGTTAPPILVFPFDDLRGVNYIKAVPALPFWWHEVYFYPEAAGVLSGAATGTMSYMVGSIDTSLPYLITRQLRDGRISSEVTVANDLPTDKSAAAYPIHVRGRVRSWRLSEGLNPLPGAILGYVGIPFGARKLIADIEIDIIDSKEDRIISSHRYQTTTTQLVSLYYNLYKAGDLALESLDGLMAQITDDIYRDTIPTRREKKR